MHAHAGNLIFVYGTLKRGFCRSHNLADQTFLEPAITVSRYLMYDCGEYPALVVDSKEGIRIHGELWRVTDENLTLLDQVEGVAENWYAREVIQLETPVITERVQAYFYLGEVNHLPRCGDNWTRLT